MNIAGFFAVLTSTLLVACTSSDLPATSASGNSAGKSDDAAPPCFEDDALAVALCLSDGCPDQFGEALTSCLQETCGEDLDAVTSACQACVWSHTEGGSKEIVQVCLEAAVSEGETGQTDGTSGSTGMSASCAGADAESLSLCLSEGCPELAGEALRSCLQETCGEDLAATDPACEACVFEHVDGGGAVIETQCL